MLDLPQYILDLFDDWVCCALFAFGVIRSLIDGSLSKHDNALLDATTRFHTKCSTEGSLPNMKFHVHVQHDINSDLIVFWDRQLCVGVRSDGHDRCLRSVMFPLDSGRIFVDATAILHTYLPRT